MALVANIRQTEESRPPLSPITKPFFLRDFTCFEINPVISLMIAP
jgi:hypothetical protein